MPPAACRRHTLWTICLCGLMEHLTDGERDIRELPLKFLLQDRDDHIFRAEVTASIRLMPSSFAARKRSYFISAVTKVSQPFASRQLQHIPTGAAANRDSFHWQATVHIPQPVGVQTSGNIGAEIPPWSWGSEASLHVRR